MSTPASDLNARLIGMLERRVPLVRRPFEQLAAELETTQSDVLARVEAMKCGGVIREISGVFDAAAMGCVQALIATAVPTEKLDLAGEATSRHPGVSHCYARADRLAETGKPAGTGGSQATQYNLWFTLAVSPLSELGLQRTAERLAMRCQADRVLVLPTLKRYKLQVRLAEATPPMVQQSNTCLPTGGRNPPFDFVQGKHSEIRKLKHLSVSQLAAVRALQRDLPATADPFAELAADAGLGADALLVQASDLLAAGGMRRYAAMLVHRAMGWAANVMVVWRVEASQADAAGQAASAFRQVSHCYLRPTAPDWPFGLYTMIHGRSEADCRGTIARVAEAAGLSDRREMWTVREYVKRRTKLFSDEEAKWEREAR